MDGKIYATISAVMDEVGAIGKNKENTQQKFMYRGVDDVMNALNPAFTKHKLFIVPEVLEQTRERRTTGKGGELLYSVCTVKYTFYAEDGSHIEAVVVGEGMDSGDKASNKALSAAFKYACFQVFCIPTEEMKDPDEDDHAPSLPAPELATDAMRQTFVAECSRIGKSKGAILKVVGAHSLEELTVDQFKAAMVGFENTPSAPAAKPDPDPQTVPPDDPNCGLPFN